MPETSRDVLVCLIDENSFTVPVKANLLGSELLDMAASHLNVKEKEYFGLYTDVDGYKNWLELDKPVLDPSQDLPKGSGQVKIFFSFKYLVDDLRFLSDFMTVELLYTHCKQAIMKGELMSDDETIFELAACAMQSQYGEMRHESEARSQLRSFPIVPSHVFKRVSVQQCEDCILQYYRMLRNLSRSEAVFKYLEIIQSLPMYSLHYFEVKDKKEVPLWLGVGPDGVVLTPRHNKNEVTFAFQWLQLQNIYYRDKKFSMEIYHNNKSGKSGMGMGPVSTYTWHGANSKIVMAIWKMARDQHVFYRSKKRNRGSHLNMNQTEIKRQLNKLHKSNISPSSSQSSLSLESAKSNQTQASAEAVAAAKAAQSEMYSALLTRRQTLMAEFEKKAARYKEILVKEMQITGIPPEGLTADEIEKMRKKFGVSFKFSKFVLDDNFGSGDEVEQLEKQLEIQSSIIEASKTLLGQANNRKLKKDRKKEIRKMEDKYQEIEQRLTDLKRNSRGSTVSGGTRFYGDSPGSVSLSRRLSDTPGGGSIDDNFLASMIFDTPSSGGGGGGGAMQKSPHHKSTSALSDTSVNAQAPPISHLSPPGHAHHHHHQQGGGSRKAQTLAAMESSSYLSSIGGFADEFEELSPSSSIASGGNISFVSSGGGGNGGAAHGLNRGASYPGMPPQGGSSGMDMADEILQHFGHHDNRHSPQPHPHHAHHQQHHHAHHHQQQQPHPSHHAHHAQPPQHTSSPTGSYNSPRKPDHAHPGGGGGGHTHHMEIPAASSPVTRYRRAASPTIGFPTESNRDFVVSHSSHHHAHHHAPSSGGAGRHASHHAHHHHQFDQRRSQSPDFPLTSTRRELYSTSYTPPSHMAAAAPNSGTRGGGGASNRKPHPHGGQSMQQRGTGGVVSPPPGEGGHGNHRERAVTSVDNRQMRFSTSSASSAGGGGVPPGSGNSKTLPNPSTRTQQQQQQQQQQGAQQATPTSSVATPPADSASGYHGMRKKSEQEMGLLEVLNMWDKSNKSPFGDGTLV